MKPCPFCANTDLFEFEYPFKRKPGLKGCYIMCKRCGACSGNYETVQEARNAWNKRREKKET